MLLFLGPRVFWFSVIISWCALSLWLTWRHRPATFPLPEPFPLMVSVVATSPLGVPLGWWLMRRDELPTVGFTCLACSSVGSLVYLVGGLVAFL
ncbi:MAG: hypothetical protein GQE15_11370 [Archangiaceae bacterium]|nr:hypothetical protein [Archangiaceae bacterium]